MFLFAWSYDDLGNDRRGEGVHHELGRVHVPGHDVDLFSAKFLDDILHSRALHSHARTYGIHVGIA